MFIIGFYTAVSVWEYDDCSGILILVVAGPVGIPYGGIGAPGATWCIPACGFCCGKLTCCCGGCDGGRNCDGIVDRRE